MVGRPATQVEPAGRFRLHHHLTTHQRLECVGLGEHGMIVDRGDREDAIAGRRAVGALDAAHWEGDPHVDRAQGERRRVQCDIDHERARPRHQGVQGELPVGERACDQVLRPTRDPLELVPAGVVGDRHPCQVGQLHHRAGKRRPGVRVGHPAGDSGPENLGVQQDR